MARCIPTATATTNKTELEDTTGQKVVVGCKCLTFDEVKALIAANNTEMPRPKAFLRQETYDKNKFGKIPDELIMAIISLEAPCEGNRFIGAGGKRIDIEFDPCAKNSSSSAVGLTQLLKDNTIGDLVNKGVIIGSTVAEEHAKICGNAALAIKYGSWNIQIKCIYARKIEDRDKRLEAAVNSAGTGSPYGKSRIAEMKKLQASYTKETLLEIMSAR